MPKNKKELIPCPVDSYCRNWDQHNECCQDNGCRESGFRKITKEDVSFYKNKKVKEAEEIELKISLAEARMSS